MNVYKTRGTCSREIRYSVKDGIVENIEVVGGCAGNLSGICRLIKGMPVEQVIKAAKEQGRKGVVLTCKDKLVHYYAKFGFVDEGISGSTHGNVVWHQMRVRF